ncbi:MULTISPECIES: hypothetical protein [Enterobacterales]|uniref:hypothetical protein n=1 Tax=Enterobacterales TaxID=91347 RepID=UPI0008482FA2|nr:MULTISPECIES: hypothetical protein [Enterobacterales]ODQ06460.1 hypothetical protein BGK50_17950 [Shigella sp. FC130]OEI93997.1 hypothetical protein BHE86_16715 [Shigella sp. FC1655]WPF03449.1 hypothetical protein SB028_14950 [Proteus vulgaris]
MMKNRVRIALSFFSLLSVLILLVVVDFQKTKERDYCYKRYNLFSYLLNTSSIIKSVPRISSNYFFSGDGIIDRGFREGGVTFCSINDWNKAYKQLREYTDKLDIPVYYGQPKIRHSQQYLQIYKYENCLYVSYSENYNLY